MTIPPMSGDTTFTTREALEAWFDDEHRYLAKFDDPTFVALGIGRIEDVWRAHAHLIDPPTPTSNIKDNPDD